MSARPILVGLWLLSGCVGAAPPPPGNSSSGGDSETGPSSASSTSPGPTTTDPGPTTGEETTDPAPTTSPPIDSTSTGQPATDAGGDAVLTISDGPEYDFGDVALGDSQLHAFIVTNEGGTEATDLQGQPLGAPFEYLGGAFPGIGGDCSSTLAAGESCIVEVAFSPTDLGLYGDTLIIAYDQGAEASRPLLGGGAGDTGNLLTNPGGETIGEPPPGWVDGGPGTWVAGNFGLGPPPFQGQNYIYAYTGFGGVAYALQQDVDVSQWATLIDQDALSVSFEGYARARDVANDEHRIQIMFRDLGGGTLGSYSTGWQSEASWTLYDEQRSVPAGTRIIRVVLGCQKSSGQYCDGYFDGLDLRVSYP